MARRFRESREIEAVETLQTILRLSLIQVTNTYISHERIYIYNDYINRQYFMHHNSAVALQGWAVEHLNSKPEVLVYGQRFENHMSL